MSKLTIITGEDAPVLRRKTERIPAVTKDIKKLMKDMQKTVKGQGVGLAAPQIGQSLRLCLTQINGKMTPLINPDIVWRSAETATDEEGCLSLPGVWLKITRPTEIIVEYIDENGDPQERHLKDFDARVVQHEVDHLEGVLIVDY